MLYGAVLCYLVGSQVFAHAVPKLWPYTFGFHELWHLLVVVASALTYSCNCSLVSRF
jgi:predicted membrane channel-forming protein YqfA (hemolysin III family)